MDEETQAVFMQVRIARLAADRWGMSLADAVGLMARHGALAYVGDCFDYFHLEGDEAVLDDVEEYLAERGVVVGHAA